MSSSTARGLSDDRGHAHDTPTRRFALDPLTGLPGDQLALRAPITDTICQAIALGMSLSGAARRAGVTPRTATAWRQRGRAVQERVESGEAAFEDLDPRNRAVMLFAVRVARAEADAEVAAVRTLRVAIVGALTEDGSLAFDANGRLVRAPDWRAAMAWLERRHPTSWRRAFGGDGQRESEPAGVPHGRPMRVVVTPSGGGADRG